MGQVWLYLYFYIPATKWSGHIHVVTSVTHFRNSEIKQLSPFFFVMLWDIDLIFGMWVYTDQVYVLFRSNDFWLSMALGPWNLAKYLVFTTLFHWFEILTLFLVWECIIINYRSSEICSGWLIFCQLTAVGLWNLGKYLVVITLFHYDLRYWLKKWFLQG
jgi:hypothetical protein